MISSTNKYEAYYIIILIALFSIVIFSVIVIWRQPQNTQIKTFKVF